MIVVKAIVLFALGVMYLALVGHAIAPKRKRTEDEK
jgi:hypothetical protein